MRVAVIEVLEVLDGLWCAACALPSGVKLTVVTNAASMSTIVRCADCGSDQVDEADA